MSDIFKPLCSSPCCQPKGRCSLICCECWEEGAFIHCQGFTHYSFQGEAKIGSWGIPQKTVRAPCTKCYNMLRMLCRRMERKLNENENGQK